MSQPSIHPMGEPTIRAFDDPETTMNDSSVKSETPTQQPKLTTTAGSDGNAVQRCEDERIHLPGAIQRAGLLVALVHTEGSRALPVCVASENSEKIIGRSPQQLFALQSFADIFSENQAGHLIACVDLVIEHGGDATARGPELFQLSLKVDHRHLRNLWCAIHQSHVDSRLIICEFEIESDKFTPEVPDSAFDGNLAPEARSRDTRIHSRHGVVLSGKKHQGEGTTIGILNVMSRIEERLAKAQSLEILFQTIVELVKELTDFHRVMVYQFDSSVGGRVVAELADPSIAQHLYKGLSFPASDIPKQARELYKINRVRVVYDRDSETARLIHRTGPGGDWGQPLDLTHSYLRAMSPIHLKYLKNMAVRSSMSVSINGPTDLWGLIICHLHDPCNTRISFPSRRICQLIGDIASRNIQRLSNVQALGAVNETYAEINPRELDISPIQDFLTLFRADSAFLYTEKQAKLIGHPKNPQEALAVLEYFKIHRICSVTASVEILEDFPDLNYPPGFKDIAGFLVVPLSAEGDDFVVLFRSAQSKEVRWAGNPYTKTNTESGSSEPRKNFEVWTETVTQTCEPWSREDTEAATVLCMFSERCFQVWNEMSTATQNGPMTQLLLANTAHEVRTPLNAVFNFLEIAMEDSLDPETRKNIAKSYLAARALVSATEELLIK